MLLGFDPVLLALVARNKPCNLWLLGAKTDPQLLAGANGSNNVFHGGHFCSTG